MEIGIGVGYWGLGVTKDDQLEIARQAEELGFDAVWVAEAYGSDAVSVLGHLAATTSRVKLGSAILQIPGRSAAMTAMSAATLDQLSGGRFVLGLGASGPQVSEGWHGVRFGRQLARTRDYVNVVRMALARERVAYEGETLTLPLPDGPGRSLKLTIAPAQDRLPIVLAAMGPKNVALAGEIADGWLPTFFSPEHVAELRAPLIEGARKAGRDPSEVAVIPQVAVCVDDDVDAARDTMRFILGLYIGGMGSRKKNFYVELVERYGFGEIAREIQDLYLSGRKDEAEAALPAELIDATCICGPADVVRARLDAFRDAGVDQVLALPTPLPGQKHVEQVRRLAEVAVPAAR
ncbi:LLM class F420-dependent oxidoreductase [Patulibacter brassicae]|uniref:LLM class F420-dependent oxidoreductase n=1 Tax=Patulibacter brassicae TaxID=1705717 RepID=A0ABU4VF31_9ACTN|nr:LLM class F420-dependent oxidoreductase [Patulibacter brassicae]MDX8150398.1 LLM class F420-dependent oxidoreductase [Patulibacter brassicae]